MKMILPPVAAAPEPFRTVSGVFGHALGLGDVYPAGASATALRDAAGCARSLPGGAVSSGGAS
jgi:hypothetical protein